MPARLWLNVVTPGELEAVDWPMAEGVGLFRTEALFLEKREDFPNEDEQADLYSRLFSLCGDRPVTVRTLDAGGDKPLRYLSLGREADPQLGLRAHRLYRYHPELLITQVRAILRATSAAQVREALDRWHEEACPREPRTRGAVLDPVCMMAVDPDSTPYHLEREGEDYFFCQRRCMDAFQQQGADR
jgi:YHS domain-containing protein/phosphoenolpyruvate synthase/pyruvate phosphate dikinase